MERPRVVSMSECLFAYKDLTGYNMAALYLLSPFVSDMADTRSLYVLSARSTSPSSVSRVPRTHSSPLYRDRLLAALAFSLRRCSRILKGLNGDGDS